MLSVLAIVLSHGHRDHWGLVPTPNTKADCFRLKRVCARLAGVTKVHGARADYLNECVGITIHRNFYCACGIIASKFCSN